MGPNPGTPLVGVLTLTTDEPTSVTLDVNDGSNSWILTFDDLEIDHALPVLGFRPNKTHTIEVSVVDAAGNQTTAGRDIVVTTDPLPPGFPPIAVVSNPDRMEPGVTLFDVIPRGVNEDFGHALIAVDETGEVVWYHRASMCLAMSGGWQTAICCSCSPIEDELSRWTCWAT